MNQVWQVALAVSVLSSLPASGKGLSLVQASCVHVQDGVVLPLAGFRYEGGKFRCTARVAVDKKQTGTDLDLSVRLLQKPERDGDREERGQAAQKVSLFPGFKGEIEVELPMPESLNGCMPFTLVLEIGGQSRRVTAKPACGD